MRIYYDKDECCGCFPQESPTIQDKEGIEIDDDLWNTYMSLDRAYWCMNDYIEKLFNKDTQ